MPEHYLLCFNDVCELADSLQYGNMVQNNKRRSEYVI